MYVIAIAYLFPQTGALANCFDDNGGWPIVQGGEICSSEVHRHTRQSVTYDADFVR